MSDLYASGLTRLSGAAFTTTAAAISGTYSSTNNVRLVRMGAVKPRSLRHRGIQMMFTSNADNATGVFAVWARFAGVSDGNEVTGGPIISLGTGTFTSGSAIGASGGTIGASEFIADTVAFTPSAFCTALLGNLSASYFAHSPADNTVGLLRIEDTGNLDIIIDVWRNSATSVSAYYEVLV